MVLFTNFSKTDTSNDSGEFSFDEDEETNEETMQDSLSFDLLVQKFREDLVTKLIEDHSSSKFEAQRIVDKILPSHNFFAFKNIKG